MMMGGGGWAASRAASRATTGAEGRGRRPCSIAQALKKETVEANEDMLGKNVQKEDIRRKTEQQVRHGLHAVAPGDLRQESRDGRRRSPESRRPLLQNYFVRKK